MFSIRPVFDSNSTIIRPIRPVRPSSGIWTDYLGARTELNLLQLNERHSQPYFSDFDHIRPVRHWFDQFCYSSIEPTFEICIFLRISERKGRSRPALRHHPVAGHDLVFAVVHSVGARRRQEDDHHMRCVTESAIYLDKYLFKINAN